MAGTLTYDELTSEDVKRIIDYAESSPNKHYLTVERIPSPSRSTLKAVRIGIPSDYLVPDVNYRLPHCNKRERKKFLKGLAKILTEIAIK